MHPDSCLKTQALRSKENLKLQPQRCVPGWTPAAMWGPNGARRGICRGSRSGGNLKGFIQFFAKCSATRYGHHGLVLWRNSKWSCEVLFESFWPGCHFFHILSHFECFIYFPPCRRCLSPALQRPFSGTDAKRTQKAARIWRMCSTNQSPGVKIETQLTQLRWNWSPLAGRGKQAEKEKEHLPLISVKCLNHAVFLGEPFVCFRHIDLTQFFSNLVAPFRLLSLDQAHSIWIQKPSEGLVFRNWVFRFRNRECGRCAVAASAMSSSNLSLDYSATNLRSCSPRVPSTLEARKFQPESSTAKMPGPKNRGQELWSLMDSTSMVTVSSAILTSTWREPKGTTSEIRWPNGLKLRAGPAFMSWAA